jgi:hypothetical protein
MGFSRLKKTPNKKRTTEKKKPLSKGELAAQALREQLVQECLTLRKKGQSHRAIAETITEAHRMEDAAFSITYRTVGNYLREALDELAQQNQESATELREMELSRLDWLMESIAQSVDAGDPTAINTALRISESRRKLLGIDAPQKVAPVTPDGKNEYVGLGDTERTEKLLALIDAARARAGA